MPINIKIDKNGVDVTDVKLKKNSVNTEVPLIKKVNKVAYKNNKNSSLYFDPSEISLYDVPMNKDFVKHITLNSKISYPVKSADVEQLLAFKKIDNYSNTTVPIVAPKLAISSSTVPYPKIESLTTLKCNDEPLNLESINRDIVDYYNQYSLSNFSPLGSQENVKQTSDTSKKVMIKRLSEAKNTYRSDAAPLSVKYKNQELKEMYEKRPKFENNKMNPFVGPSIKSHMKNHDRFYQQDLELL